MTTQQITITALEFIAVALLFIGFKNEDKIINFEDKLFKKLKKYRR